MIARNTAFTFKGKAVDVKKLGRELNVRYVLEGSVQRGGNRLRVNVQLIDAETGKHLWAERFDKPVADLFDMQDEIVSRLANALDAELIVAEARASGALTASRRDGFVFSGQGLLEQRANPRSLMQARGFFERALALDPKNVEALVGMALVDTTIGSSRYGGRPVQHLRSRGGLLKALSLAPNHALATCFLGMCKCNETRGSKVSQNASRRWRWIAIWPLLMRFIGLAKLLLGREARKPKLTSTRHSGFLLAIPSLSVDGMGRRSPRCSSMPMPKRSSGCAGASTPTETIPSRISISGLRWRARGAVGRSTGRRAAGLALDPSFTIHRFCARCRSDNPTFLAGRERVSTGCVGRGLPD